MKPSEKFRECDYGKLTKAEREQWKIRYNIDCVAMYLRHNRWAAMITKCGSGSKKYEGSYKGYTKQTPADGWNRNMLKEHGVPSVFKWIQYRRGYPGSIYFEEEKFLKDLKEWLLVEAI